MARLSNPGLQGGQTNDFDSSSAELGLLLSRLTQNVLYADPEREQRLRTSEYERAKVEANLEYARTALTKLEQEAMHMLAPGRRVELQTDLNQKREQLELLLDRIQDLHKIAVDPEDDDSEGEDLLANIIPTPSASESMASTTTDVRVPTPSTTDAGESSIPAPPAEPEPPTPQPPPTETPTQTTSTVTSRTPHSAARQALFASRRPKSPDATTATTTATAEAILSREASEREYLADRVLHLAQAMKKKQIDIAADLESEKDVLGRATEGMERAGMAMDTVRGAMGAVTRMAEGEGWWGRMMLYVWIYGMMVGLVLLVFVFPKLRF